MVLVQFMREHITVNNSVLTTLVLLPAHVTLDIYCTLMEGHATVCKIFSTNNPSQKSLHFSHTGINPCLVNNGGCDHICTYTGANTRECSCIPPYELSLDGVTCLKLPIIKPPPTGFPTVGPPPRPIGKCYRVEHSICNCTLV